MLAIRYKLPAHSSFLTPLVKLFCEPPVTVIEPQVPLGVVAVNCRVAVFEIDRLGIEQFLSVEQGIVALP